MARLIKPLFSPPEAKVEDRQIKRHQKRLSTGAATSIQLGTSGGTSGLTEVAGNGRIRKTTSSNLENGGGGSNNQKSASSSNKSNAQKPKEQHILGKPQKGRLFKTNQVLI